VTLRRADGTVLRDLPDPAGGTFDAAGDFEDLFGSADLPVLGALDPYDDTELSRSLIPGLLTDLHRAIPLAAGSRKRGLARLQVMAERCQSDASLRLHLTGD
jgi:hypothetical protein